MNQVPADGGHAAARTAVLPAAKESITAEHTESSPGAAVTGTATSADANNRKTTPADSPDALAMEFSGRDASATSDSASTVGDAHGEEAVAQPGQSGPLAESDAAGHDAATIMTLDSEASTDPLNLSEATATGTAGAGGEMPSAEAQKSLAALSAYYLCEVRRSDGQPRDPVARFHLGNGAQLDAVLAAADISDKGLSQSAGVMVSYLYDLDKVIENHEAYARSFKVTRSRAVDRLLGQNRWFFGTSARRLGGSQGG